MTVCIAVRVNECIVLAADSATTLSIRRPDGSESLNVFRHGHKVFNLYKGLPIGAMTYGTGNIGRASISMLMKEFRERLNLSADWLIDPRLYTIEEVVDRARKFLYEEKFRALDPPPVWSQPLGLFVAGYSANSDAHELWSIVLSGANGVRVCPSSGFLGQRAASFKGGSGSSVC